MSEWERWAILIVAVLASGAGWLWRRAEGRSTRLQAERERLDARCHALEDRLERSEKARTRQGEELATFRKKADKTRRRGARAPSPPLGTATRIQDLEEALARSEREREAAQRACVERTEELADLRRALDERPAEAAPARTDPVATVDADSRGEEEARHESERLAASRRIAELEGELRAARQGEARMKKRVANQEQLYAAIRAELAVKKDRLRTQEEQLERLQALRVSLVD